MSLRGALMESLLTWVNSLKVDEAIERLSQMQDLSIFIKIITKLNGNLEEAARILKQPTEERLKFLQRHCRCGSKAEDLVQWQKIVHGENSDLEICKVIVLLFYVSNMKSKDVQEWETFDHKTQTELASILRFVLDNEDDLSLDDKLISFLQGKERVLSSGDSASSSDETMSPNVTARKTQVRFLELHRVASSSTMKSSPLDSPSSPMSEVLHMPQFQIRRLRKQLIEGRDLRDELELELSETKKRLAEKEAQIYLMQQRIERLVILNEKQEDQQEPRELEELREKNESLMIRLRDTLKQCQDLKTDRNQLERKNDQFSEEHRDLSYKVRDLSGRLAELQEALNETTEEHEASVVGWQKQQNRLEAELNLAITEKKSLEERNQILQEKISMLEEQLKKIGESESQDKGERLGDVLKLENLQQEVVSLNVKSSELEAQISSMEEEKMAVKADAEAQKSRFESEKMQLQDIVTNLQTSLSEITFQKEKQDQDARRQEETLTCQITTLKLEISKLKMSLTRKDQELSGLQAEVEDERRQRGQLELVLQKQEESSKKSIAELGHQVEHLDSTLRQTEGKLLEINEQLGLNTQQMLSVQQERDKCADERDSTITMFNEYKKAKEEEVTSLGKTCQALQGDHQAGVVAVEELKKEKAELALKVRELDATILDLLDKCHHLDAENDAQDKSHAAALESLKTRISEQEAQMKIYEQKVSGMELLGEENAEMKEQLLSLKEMLEKERETSASLESERKKSAELEGKVKSLRERRDQAIANLDKEKSAVVKLESRVTQLGEEFQAKTDNLQEKLSESSAATRQREEEIGKLTKEMCTWKERADSSRQAEVRLQSLKKEHDEVCQQLANERLKVSRHEAACSAQLDQVRHLEAELSAAKAQLGEKEAQEKTLLHTIRSTEEKLRSAQQEDAERVSQLEITCSNKAQELQALAKELSGEKQKIANLQAELKRLEEQKSEKIAALESKISSMRKARTQSEQALQELSADLDEKKTSIKEAHEKHQQELLRREDEHRCLAGERDKVLQDLKTEQEAKREAEAQLQKYMDGHKNEFSALQNELSRSLDLITMKESELERLTKEVASREEDVQLGKRHADGLTEEVDVLKKRSVSQDEEIKRYIKKVKDAETETNSLKAALPGIHGQVTRLEQELQSKVREVASVQQQYQATVGEVQALQSRTAELESRCSGLEDAVNVARKEAAEAKTNASEKASASEQHQKGMQTLAAEVQQERQRTCELGKQLDESRALQTETEASLEALKKELFHKVQELEQSQKTLSESSRDLTSARSAAQEREKELSETKEQAAYHQKEAERKKEQIQSLQKELNNMATKLASSERSSGESKELLTRESSRSSKLAEQLRTAQGKLEASSKEVLDKQATIQSLTAEASSYQDEAGKQRATVEGLQKTLSSCQASTASLEKDIKSWQEKFSQKEAEMSGVQHQLLELESIQSLYQEMKAEQSQRESRHQEERLQNQATVESLQQQLEKSKAEAASVLSLKGALDQKEKMLETLQKEMKDHREQITSLQEEIKHQAGENETLSQAYMQEVKKVQTELAEKVEKHEQELETLRLQYEKKTSEGEGQLQDISSKYEHAKAQILDDRQKFQEEKQKLLTQVDQLEAVKKEQSDQVQDLNKQLEKTTEHYKSQMEKAKVHYDVKKQQSQQLSEELQSVTREQETLRKENAELKAESERSSKELQRSLLQNKEAEKNCKTLTGQVRSLEAQVENANRQLGELVKTQPSDAMKSRETQRSPRVTRSHADVSIDSLDMSDEEEDPPNSTRKNGRSHQLPSKSTAKSSSPKAPAANRLPRKVESLESLYFTPIPTRVRSKLDSSIGSIPDLSLDSSKKTRSARRRTTQVINITMTKSTKEEGEPESPNTSFYSLRSAPSQQNLHQPQDSRRRGGGKPQPASSAPALTSLPSLESLVKPEHTSSDDSLNNSVLLSLPGYRPTTRSSARLSQAGASGRSSFYVNTCQDEPEPQEDWSRIAELQQRNRACPPHLKTSYPLESRTTLLTSSITDEEVKTGDPQETLRRATLLPSQIQESVGSTRRMTLASPGTEHSWAGGGITTRQQRKRVSEEPHYGPDTPESKKSASCFPRPMTPKEKPETRRSSTAESKAGASQQSHPGRRQTTAFSILNTPKKLGSSLKRGLSKISTPKSTPQGRGGTSKGPLLALRKSPNRKSPRGPGKSPKNTKKKNK
ncbi:nuclear mitotic apparatus protein 1 isoform X2 [Phyllobates terribilis]